MVSAPSALMPLPPAPVLVRFNVPPLMVILPSAPRQEADFVFSLSASQAPPPLVFTVIVPSVMIMSPSLLIPLQAAAVILALNVPPFIYMLPVSSSS